jgi:glycosyltransferase involved in cell wall biosynthesis
MRSVARKNPDVQLQLHGTNLEVQGKKFQEEFGELLADTPENVILFGRYDSEQVPELMAAIDYVVLPSLWWENSPRVIQEAFANGRPVICSGIGGMAEKVTHGVNGLHFRVGDPVSLADAILEAVKPGVWERLQGNFPPVHTMEDHVRNLSRYYLEVIERRSGVQPAPTREQEQFA